MEIKDMPKLESPFIRKLNEKNEYLVTPEITPGFEWVFQDESVIATEKMHGTNVSVVVENGQVTSIWNRTERIPFINKGKAHIVEGVLEAYTRGYFPLGDGQFFGELIGPKVNGNPYGEEKHVWLPFSNYAKNHLKYTSWGKYPKTFEAISAWFEKDLFSIFKRQRAGVVVPPEGIVFVHPDGRMAKLRRDMFPWFVGFRHKGGDEKRKEAKP